MSECEKRRLEFYKQDGDIWVRRLFAGVEINHDVEPPESLGTAIDVNGAKAVIRVE